MFKNLLDYRHHKHFNKLKESNDSSKSDLVDNQKLHTDILKKAKETLEQEILNYLDLYDEACYALSRNKDLEERYKAELRDEIINIYKRYESFFHKDTTEEQYKNISIIIKKWKIV